MEVPRLLPRSSGPVLGAIAVLGVGVGLAAMVFALADPYVARALPYADPDRLVAIEFGLGDPQAMLRARQGDVPSVASWQERTDLFDGLAAFDDAGWLRIRLADRTIPLRAVAVTGNLLAVLGLDDRRGSDDTAAWVSRRAAAVLSTGEFLPGGSVPLLPGGTLRVERVLPGSFLFPQANRMDPVDVLVMLPPGPIITITPSGASALTLVARMREGMTPEMIETALAPGIRAIGRSLSVVPLRTRMTARELALARGAAFASALVILVCWMNVFNIGLTRGLYREPELAIRTALGATPSRIVCLVMADGLRVAAAGSAGALAVAWVALEGAVRVLPSEFATMGVPSVTVRVAGFICAAGAVAWLCWSNASILAWRLGARNAARCIPLRDGRAIRAMRFGVIAGQVGAASVFLAAAALLGRSYLNLLLVDAGMDHQTQTVTVAHDPGIPPAVRVEMVERVLTALRQGRGVQSVGIKSGGMLNGRTDFQGLVIGGRFAPLEWNAVDRGFLEAAGFEFLVGGLPAPGRSGAVITERMVLEYFDGDWPVGVVLNPGRAVPVVGVVRDVRTLGLSVAPRSVVYEVGAWSSRQSATFTYVVRVAEGAPRLGDWARILRPIDPMAVVLNDDTVGERLARSVRDRTFATLVVGLFAAASVLVTALGLAGVVAYTVVRRTREVAVRLTLGATRPSVSWLVARDALSAGVCGATVGFIASVWLSGTLESLLYGVQAADPPTLALAAVCLLGIVIIAAVVPGIRTGRIAPAATLRSE